MLRATLYRPLRPGETPPPGAIRVRQPVAQPTDPRRPKAGLRCPSPVCVLTLVLVEADLDRYTPPFGHNPNLASLNCPYCGNRLRLVGYFEVTHLISADE
jgi:hypothetical protein